MIFLKGTGKIKPGKKVLVTDEAGNTTEYTANHIILATGTRSRELPNLKQDGKKIIGYRQAMNLPKQPKSMVVVGSGAIGSEFAYFYKSIGTEVTLIELLAKHCSSGRRRSIEATWSEASRKPESKL